jgi:magnesium transporter
MYPEEAARALETLSAREVLRVLETEPPRQAVAVLERMTPEAASEALEALSKEFARQILPALDPARAAALLARLDAEARARLLALVEPGLRRELESLMTYPPDSAGHLMDPSATTFRPETRAEEALARLRAQHEIRVSDVFLVEGEGLMVGSAALQDIALADPATRLRELVQGPPVSVPVTATREEVVEILTQRRLASLPVVDFEGRLLGVLRHAALVDAAREDATADLQTMVGASKDERALSKVTFAVRKRLPWLEINLGTAFLAASVVGMFEGTIARFTALAVLLPVVAGQSGNTGAQALAVTMRGLTLREVRLRHWPRVTFKEATVALINGLAVAFTTSLGVFLWSRSVGLAIVIGLSMVISMVAAGLSGAMIPMILVALRQDPAQSSSIILTTVTDIVGFFSFLGIATALSSLL